MNVKSVVFKYHAFFILVPDGQTTLECLIRLPSFHIPWEMYDHYNL